ncbi:putative ester cyclase [Chitinophaga polysaccharea]|uniref:Putative ester cyclase n=1 Tax=Chitinophaga polysaccharea TaxID=1293035 RepID=A0A561Q454_9BACT|nr:ester cyclase [Chitinophaga polysaccharea]TWF45125.1 putative ester cyclase [Chitinophaga polysaccharea]
MTIHEQKAFIDSFISIIWNQGNISRVHEFLHPEFTDHSLAPSLPAGIAGLQQWIAMTHTSFLPITVIEEQVAELGKAMIRVTMQMKHIGTWRGIPATGITVTTRGYRCFHLKDNRIIAHWALIDGDTLEKKLTAYSTGQNAGS